MKVFDVFGILKKKPEAPGQMPWKPPFFKPTAGPGTGPGSGGGRRVQLRPAGIIYGFPP